MVRTTTLHREICATDHGYPPRDQIKSPPTFIKREQNHRKRRQERPHNADRNPRGKSSKGIHMLREEEWEWNKQNKGDELGQKILKESRPNEKKKIYTKPILHHVANLKALFSATGSSSSVSSFASKESPAIDAALS